jgi:hypothetical protein
MNIFKLIKLGKLTARYFIGCEWDTDIKRVSKTIQGHSADLGESCGQGDICVNCIIRMWIHYIETIRKQLFR